MVDLKDSIVNSPHSLSPLPQVLHRGLIAVAFFGSLSFLTSCSLFCYLVFHLHTSRKKFNTRIVQFFILITNLIWADVQQSIAFALNAVWVFEDAIMVETKTCLAQGWFVSTGDMASGVFTLAIAVHCFTDIILGYRIKYCWFLLWIIGLWLFIYAFAIAGIASHHTSLNPYYARAGAWCWINRHYINDRLWLHYFWVITSEFGTVLVYTTTIAIIRHRLRSGRYFLSRAEKRAAEIAVRSMVWYPLVYCLCTLPLVVARLRAMAGGQNSFVGLCVAGSIITSCGWLDVVLFLMTRRAVPFMAGEDMGVLATFAMKPWYAKRRGPFGTTTTITTAGPAEDEVEIHTRTSSEGNIVFSGEKLEHVKSRVTLETRHSYGIHGEVKLTTVKTVDIRSEVMQEKDKEEMLGWEDAVRASATMETTSQEELMFARLTEQLRDMERIERESTGELDVEVDLERWSIDGHRPGKSR